MNDTKVKEDDVLRFIAGLTVFAALARPPKDDPAKNMLAVVGSVCIMKAVRKLFTPTFSNPRMEKLRQDIVKKLDDNVTRFVLPTELIEEDGDSLAFTVSEWVVGYIHNALEAAGDAPLELAKEVGETHGLSGQIIAVPRAMA